MRSLLRTVPPLLLTALLVGLNACDQSQTRIIGKWQVKGGASAIVWEFAENGVAKAGNSPGRYSFGDRNRLKIQTQFATFVYEVKFSDSTMVWKDPNGARTQLTRVR
ncbi:MAG: hypothetical protein ABR589_13010 [Chthoniobacterales bacterium]